MSRAHPTNAKTPDNGFPGLGAAFLVEPTTGVLPPWGVTEISVTSFNDTPGRYTDKLELTFTGEIYLRKTLSGSYVGCKRVSVAVGKGMVGNVLGVTLARIDV